MFSLHDYYMGRDKDWPPTQEQVANAIKLLDSLGKLEKAYGSDLVLTSGYRPTEVNTFVAGSARNSLHAHCAAADLRDVQGKLSAFCLKNLDLLEQLGLWMEDPKDAKNHVHLQLYPPKSGRRVFRA